MRVNARLLRSLANREPGRGHKTENDKENEEYGECGGHTFITDSSKERKAHARTCFKSRECGYILLNEYAI